MRRVSSAWQSRLFRCTFETIDAPMRPASAMPLASPASVLFLRARKNLLSCRVSYMSTGYPRLRKPRAKVVPVPASIPTRANRRRRSHLSSPWTLSRQVGQDASCNTSPESLRTHSLVVSTPTSRPAQSFLFKVLTSETERRPCSTTVRELLAHLMFRSRGLRVEHRLPDRRIPADHKQCETSRAAQICLPMRHHSASIIRSPAPQTLSICRLNRLSGSAEAGPHNKHDKPYDVSSPIESAWTCASWLVAMCERLERPDA